METEKEQYKRLMCKLLGIELDSNDIAMDDYKENGKIQLYIADSHFTFSRFDTSLDWLRPVVLKCIDLNIWESEQTNWLHDALLKLDTKEIFNSCGEFLKQYYNGSNN